jgi:hypothetical protein
VHFYKDDTTRLELIRTEAVVVTMEDEPFASGGVCEAHRIWLIRADGEKGPMQVAKRYKFKDGKQGFREDHVNSYLAGCLTAPFNELLRARLPDFPTVRFVQCIRLLELKNEWYSVEEHLEGKFTKYNNIFGDVERQPWTEEEKRHFDVAAAFSHFSFLHSDHEYAVLDIQGVGSTYTDPAIVSLDQLKYGYTDTGYSALQSFFQKHTCNHVCKELGLCKVDGNRPLPKPTATKPKAPVPSAGLKPKLVQRHNSMPSSKAATMAAVDLQFGLGGSQGLNSLSFDSVNGSINWSSTPVSIESRHTAAYYWGGSGGLLL